jgi:hypothetical protein
MQRTLFIVSRLVFTGTVLVLFIALFLGVLIGVSRSKPNDLILSRTKTGKVVLAEQNNLSGDLKQETVANEVISADARPLLIKKYLAKYKSPLLPYSDLIFKLSQTYGFDYYWMVAIAQQESNLCKNIPDDSHNCWGYGINSAGTLKFDNYELALTSYAQYLKREYFDKGLNTPELIMKKYCPHSNGSWAFGVNQFINEIESGQF